MKTSNIGSQTILFLAANPQGTVALRLDRELRDIGEGLQRAQKRDRFNLEQRSAVRPRDIQRAMLDVEPQILHFSGHGAGEAGLVFEDESGNSQLVDGDALAGLFELFADKLNCVVLNGCYSEVQAQEIARHIPYVIGMNKAIGDTAAISFAVGFYDALGAGRDVEFAFKLGCAAIWLEGSAEHLTPVLIRKPIAAGDEVNLTSQPVTADGEKPIDPILDPAKKSPASTGSDTGEPKLEPIDVGQQALQPEKQITTKFSRPVFRNLLRSGFLISLVTAGISIVRFCGVLQPLELTAYDLVMRSRHLSEGQDDHILVIKVIAQDEPDRVINRSNTLSDQRLDKLLGLLKQHDPSVIGFANFLNHKIDTKHQNIQKNLRSDDFFVVCQATENRPEDFKAPDNAKFIGFADIFADDDRVLRRHLLQMKIVTPACKQYFGLSLLLADYYLRGNNQSINLPFENDYGQVGNKTIKFLSNYVGGYQQFAPMNKNDTRGWQIMLNYRYVNSVLDGFSSISINDLFNLSESDRSARIKDRIILIGTTEKKDNQDLHATPYGEKIPGVFLQAQMTSQLVNAALYNRPLIWGYSLGGEVPLIWLMVGVGWLVGSQVRNRWILVGVSGLVIIMLWAGAVVLLTVVGYWFPLVPAWLGFGLGCSSVTIFPIVGTKLRRLSSKS